MTPGGDSVGDEREPTDAELEPAPELAGLLEGTAPPASDAFKASLRDAFVGGSIRLSAPDPVDESELPAEIRSALDAWEPAASAGHRDAVRAAFLEAAPAATHEHELRPRPSAAPRQERAARPRRTAPAPARRVSTQLRLVVGGGLLAAAAALVILIRGGLGGPQPEPNGGDTVAQATESSWSLDATTIEEMGEQALLDAIRVDGATLASLDSFGAALENASRIEVLDSSIRVRRGDSYVMELTEGTELRLQMDDPEAPEGSDVFFAESGSIRVATGPGFEAGSPLVLHTPHLRTQVTGTIYGIDVYPGKATCVCCLEGSVAVKPVMETAPSYTVQAKSTHYLAQAEERANAIPLLQDHGDPLRDLQGYWL